MNPCMRCGACCACFRVSFPAAEVDDAPNGTVPAAATVLINGHMRAMKGTEGKNPRCTALSGFVGSNVHCTLYDRRPSTCRGFVGAWEADMTNPVCNRARAYFGLPPFELF